MSVRRLQLVLDLDTGRYSGRLRQAGTEMQRFGGQAQAASSNVRHLGNSFDRVGSSLTTPTQKLREYVLLLGNLRLASIAITSVSALVAGNFIKQSAEVERLTMLMVGLSNATTEFGKNQEAQKSLQSLYDMSRNSGFAVKELSDAFVKFKAGGLDPTNGSLQSLVDATARFGGTSETMHRASIAIQQMSGKGVISMEELRQQLGEAVPTAIRDMARAMGMGVGALVKEISDGKVKAGPALAALFDEWERMYSGSAKRMSQTLNGQMAQLRTNIMEASTLFTNLGGNITPAIRADLEEQQRLYEQGKITAQQFEQASEHIRASAEKQGVYTSSIAGLKSLNEALQTDQAKAAIIQFGQAVDKVMSGLIAGVQHIVRWRSEYGTAIQIILSGMAMIMARNLGQWMYAQFTSMGGMWQNLRVEMSSLGMAWGQMTGQLNNLGNARVRELAGAQQQMAVAQQQQAQVGTWLASSQRKVAALQAEQRATQQHLVTLQARHRALSTEATLAARNIQMNGRSAASVAALARAENNLNASTLALGQTRERLIMIDGQLVAAERVLTQAMLAEKVAADAASAAQTRHAAATGFMATAARIGGAALTFLGRAFSMLLGPIGMVIMILGTLAMQLGVFTTQAQRARAAADDLRNGLISLAATKAVDGQISANNAANKFDMEALASADRRGFSERDKAKIRARIEARNKENANFTGARATGQQHVLRTRQSEWSQEWQGQIEALDGKLAHNYSNAVRAAEQRHGEGTAAYKRAVAKARADQDTARARGRRNIERRAQGWLNQPGKNPNSIEMEARRRSFAQTFNDAGDASAAAAPNIAAAGDAAGKSGGKADKAATQLGNMAEKVAVLQARAAGSGEALAKFEQQIKNGEMKNWSSAQIERGRVLAMQADALKDVAKNAGSAKQANESFDSMLISTSGQIAELSGKLDDGAGDLERFNAEVAAGKYSGVTEDRIEQMRRYLKVVEQLKKDTAWDKNITKMEKDVNRSAVESDALWESWSKGTLEADRRLNQVKERYGDVIEQAEAAAAAGDPTKLEDVNNLIERIARNMARSDTVDVMNQWKTTTEEIRVGLLSEEEARQYNFDKEMARQIALVDWTRLSAEQRMEAEKRLNDYKHAAQARLNRENEHAVIKQARQWAALGQNIQGALAGGLSSFIDGLGEAEFSFKDFVKKMLVQLLKIILQATIAYMILSAIGMANNSAGQKVSYGDFMKGQVGGGFGMGGGKDTMIGFGKGGSGLVAPNTQLPSSGRIGQVFVEQAMPTVPPRYHTGGFLGRMALKPGEVPFVGLEDEVVLTKDQQADLKGMFGGAGRGAPSVSVNIINNSGENVSAEVGEPEWNGKEMVLGIVLEAMNKEGAMRDAMRNAR